MSRVAVDEIHDRYPTHRTASPAVLRAVQPAYKYPPRRALAAALGFWRQWKGTGHQGRQGIGRAAT
jgi:hypothetical protein